MFGRGIDSLFDALPQLDELTDDRVRRLLSTAWLEVAERRELAADESTLGPTSPDLRRLALALQTHVIVAPAATASTIRACAFVAAEALDLARELDSLQSVPELPVLLARIEVGLLYLIAGYDANAAVSIRDTEIATDTSLAEQFGLRSIVALLTGAPVPVRPDPGLAADDDLNSRVRWSLWMKIGDHLSNFTRWLREPDRDDTDDAAQLADLADWLRLSPEDVPIAVHADVLHLAALASVAVAETSTRAVREVPIPESTGEGHRFDQFLVARCARQPLLWPAAAEYAAAALPGPNANAVVAVPTGAGKTAVADLAIQHALARGWVLYLAPTNALVGQIRRQLRADHPGVDVREFIGGAEYSALASEAMSEVGAGQILVMTPEKCSLALRQSPEVFADLALIVFDEAHLLGDARGRGALSELVLAEALSRAEEAKVLLMSALIANPEDLAKWLDQTRTGETIVVREPWRPTRTLRAVVGIASAATFAAAQAPSAELEGLGVHRRNVSFDAPLAVLAGLRGPWTTRKPADYALVTVAATTPMNVTRPRGGGDVTIDTSSAGVRPTVQALAQLLGDRDQKVVAFLPRSKHDSFMAALALPGFDNVSVAQDVDALLELARAELGLETPLAGIIAKGVAVHTSALLSEERRASELAFDEGDAAVLFATGTLAQGLNLPATTVIIGGTDIGYDPDRTAAEQRRQQRSQLLNAIGRAGRARVSARSLALVVPNQLPRLDADTVVDGVLPRAEFLAEEDASTHLSSALRPLLGRLGTGTMEPDDLYPSDHLAIAYLAPGTDSEASRSILQRTWAAHELGVRANVRDLVTAIGELGRRTVDESAGPMWAEESARRAGVPLPVAARFASFLVAYLSTERPPGAVPGWLELMVKAISHVPARSLDLLLQRNAFRSTALANLWSDDTHERTAALTATRETLNSWLAGEPLSVVGGHAHSTTPIKTSGRGQKDPIPRTIRLVETGIGFGMTRAAGLLAATFDVAVEQQAVPAVEQSVREALELLPLALRFGASDRAALALLRAGARPRAVAHLLAVKLDPPPRELDDGGVRTWATDQLAHLSDRVEQLPVEEHERHLIAQFIVSRRVR